MIEFGTDVAVAGMETAGWMAEQAAPHMENMAQFGMESMGHMANAAGQMGYAGMQAAGHMANVGMGMAGEFMEGAGMAMNHWANTVNDEGCMMLTGMHATELQTQSETFGEQMYFDMSDWDDEASWDCDEGDEECWDEWELDYEDEEECITLECLLSGGAGASNVSTFVVLLTAIVIRFK